MKKFTKITFGFTAQTYEKNAKGKFICTAQEFIAGDQVDYEDADGNAITPPQHKYQPFNMLLLSSTQLASRLEEAISSIDVGGEQSRQFAGEIAILKKLLKALNCPAMNAERHSKEFCI